MKLEHIQLKTALSSALSGLSSVNGPEDVQATDRRSSPSSTLACILVDPSPLPRPSFSGACAKNGIQHGGGIGACRRARRDRGRRVADASVRPRRDSGRGGGGGFFITNFAAS